jgi:hypothetical protein
VAALFAIIGEKNKDVKTAALPFSSECAKFLGEELIEARVKDQRPYLQDTLRTHIRKLLRFKEGTPELEDLGQPTKRLSFDPKSKSPVGEPSSPHEGKSKERVEHLPVSELAPKLVLKCVINFSEPTDTEVRSISRALFTFLTENIAAGLFSFQAETVGRTIDFLKSQHIFTKANTLAFYQYVYVRLYDTTRSLIFDAMEKLLEQVGSENLKHQISFTSITDTSVIFHGLVRYLYSHPEPNHRLIMQGLSTTNPNCLGALFCRLITKKDFPEKLLDLLADSISLFGSRLGSITDLKEAIGRAPETFRRKSQHLFRLIKHLGLKDTMIPSLEEQPPTEMEVEAPEIRLIQPLDAENLAKDMIRTAHFLIQSLNSQTVQDVQYFLASLEEFVATKNVIIRINLVTRKLFLQSLIAFITVLRSNSLEGLKFDAGQSISSEQLATNISNALRTFLRSNIESICLESLLEVSESEPKSVHAFKGRYTKELNRNFATLVRKIVENWLNVDAEDIFRIIEAFWRKPIVKQSHSGLLNITFLVKALQKQHATSFSEHLGHCGSPFLSQKIADISAIAAAVAAGPQDKSGDDSMELDNPEPTK